MRKKDECPEVDQSKSIKYSGWINGYVKWVDTKRGYGFIGIDYEGENRDAFIHISLLKDSKPLPDLYPVRVMIADTDGDLKVISIKYRLEEIENENE